MTDYTRKKGLSLLNQNESAQQQSQAQMAGMASQTTFGGPELTQIHASIGTISSALEVYALYEQYVQDQELMAIIERQKTFVTQIYNTILETLKSGQDPAIPTQTYKMKENNQATFGMTPSTPQAPIQSFNELGDQSVSTAILGHLKGMATHFTTTALESSHPVMRRIFADSIPNVIELAYEIFLYQNKHQYYQVPQLAQQDKQAIINSHAPISQNITH